MKKVQVALTYSKQRGYIFGRRDRMTLLQKNRQYNSKFEIKGIIFDQKAPNVANMRYGVKRLWYNGCGIIAVYNALILTGQPYDIREILDCYESKGKWLFGLWGTDPMKITYFFKLKNIQTQCCSVKNVVKGIYIILVLNKWLRGMHYMAINMLENGMVEVYNGYKNRDRCDVYESLWEMFDKTNTRCIMLVRIGN